VKKPHIEIKGAISEEFLRVVKDFFGEDDIEIYRDEDDVLEEVRYTEWYHEMEREITPAKALRNLRESNGWTQDTLGQKIGTNAQEISKLETGMRPISRKRAKKFSRLFGVSVERFICFPH